MIGRTIGPYQVVARLGAGGMGEVYRARDTKLGRDVAIKVVLEAFLSDPDRLMRFEREARSLAALNHPHVATLYGMEAADGVHFLVMELVEGATLADRMAEGPMPVEQALAIARQITQALEAAHEKGIVHRDLKPANIKITPEGQVKVLDFGLAKAAETGQGDASSMGTSPSASFATMTSPALTQMGVILGTASYMSPEQARGGRVDHRADIFSFGVVLYEMLAGRRPFQGDTISDVLAAVLAREPDLAALPHDLSPRLVELLRRCLDKHPKKRWQAIGDVGYELDAIALAPRVPPAVPIGAGVARPRRWWRRALPVAGAVLATAALTTVALLSMRPVPRVGLVSRFVVQYGADQVRTVASRPGLAVSPDGRYIAYEANDRLYLRVIDQLEARPIAGTETTSAGGVPYNPVFSPDSRSIAYCQEGAIKRIDTTGGAPVTISAVGDAATGLTWTGDSLLFASQGAIQRVPATGGQPQRIVELGAGEFAIRPRLIDEGRAVLFALARTTEAGPEPAIVEQALTGKTRTTLVSGGTDARYLPTGQLIYLSDGVLLARSFDPVTKALGGAVPVVEGVRRCSGGTVQTYLYWYDVSDNGTLVYLPGSAGAGGYARNTLALFDRDGKATPLDIPEGAYWQPRMSPDGRAIAFGVDDGRDVSIWLYEPGSGQSARRLTVGGHDRYPVWSADSQRVIFQSDREGDLGLFWQRADSQTGVARLTKPGLRVEHIPQSASPDGTVLLLDQVEGETTTLMTLALKDRTLTPFGGVQSRIPSGAVFSPDGRWIAYSARDTEGTAVTGTRTFVQPFPATGTVIQISGNNEDGHHPAWSRDGKELYYTPGPGFLLTALRVTTTGGFTFGPAPAVSRPFWNLAPAAQRPYDTAAKGGLFLGLTSTSDSAFVTGTHDTIHVVLNWFEDVNARVPGGRR